MSPRLDYYNASPKAMKAMIAMEALTSHLSIEQPLLQLIRIRASQLNGCAFCLQFHLNMARKLKVVPAKIDLVATWAEAPGLFTPKERAALAWTEALTQMTEHRPTGALYAELQAQFTTVEIAGLTAAIGAINAWNRMAGSLSFTPPVPESQLSA